MIDGVVHEDTRVVHDKVLLYSAPLDVFELPFDLRALQWSGEDATMRGVSQYPARGSPWQGTTGTLV